MLMDDVHSFAFGFGHKLTDDTEDHRLTLRIVHRLSRGEHRERRFVGSFSRERNDIEKLSPTRSRILSHHCYEIVPAAKAHHIPNSIANDYVKYIYNVCALRMNLRSLSV